MAEDAKSNDMQISLIAAVAWTGVIGKEGELPWKLPADLVHFKRVTMDHHVVMGRKTWESIGKPLGGRRILVLSASGYEPDLADDVDEDAVSVVKSLDKALALARKRGEDELMVAGGANVYVQAIERADRLYLTRIDGSFGGDAWFPWVDPEVWELVSEELRLPDAANEYPLRFQVWERQSAGEGARPSPTIA